MILSVGLAMAGSVQGASITFSWAVRDGVLEGRAEGPGMGWLAIGINDREGLAGSVLLMARPDGHVEEHIARPPAHPRRRARGLLQHTVAPDEGRQVFEFRLRLAAGDEHLTGLKPDAPVWFTLAWSRSADFGHHSAERVQRAATL